MPAQAAITGAREHGGTNHGLRAGLSAAFPAVGPLKANREHHLGRPNVAYGLAGPDHAGILTRTAAGGEARSPDPRVECAYSITVLSIQDSGDAERAG